ncbi:hypothetical protein ACTTAI_17170 [Rhodobacter capsulatus]|uniref:hypothetical protein n=1 Tax=Rhodobacter capsulatus TaxID=1061 RepID=UPI00402548A3
MQTRLDAGRATVNPEAGEAIAALAAACREKGVAVVHVRHHDPDPASPFHADAPGAQPMPCPAKRCLSNPPPRPLPRPIWRRICADRGSPG